MSYDFSVNELHKVETIRIGREQNPIIIVDDVLAKPNALVDFAAAEAAFRQPGNYYPGLRGEPLPKPYVAALLRAFNPLIGETFGAPVDGSLQANFYFGLATVPPTELTMLQRLPHFDTTNLNQIAVLHYLCDTLHGGTIFVRHRETGFESIDEARKARYFELLKHDIDANGPPPAQYVSSKDRLFEQTACFEAKFNRMLIYRSRMLHSGNVNPASNLSSDPRRGRLTANLFLAYG